MTRIINEVFLGPIQLAGAAAAGISLTLGGLAPCKPPGLTPPGPEGSNGNPKVVVTWFRRAATFFMSYIVLARKYRPRQFSELVGQQHVATTLINAFRQSKLGQAYLLTGTRGVGKTSVARIFAKALRCESPDAQPGGKSPGISCDKCASCVDINSGSSIDVLEIDGASNNGVENVREIREQVKFLPSRGRMKVYIIDEVHMLTNAAFNALLKTLEEPPAHVTFILATTEVQKIPATILSRCQRFDFRRVPLPLIQEHLSRIAELEGIHAEQAALRLVARKADGSVRDALSALDQCMALGGKKLEIKGVTESLGIVSGGFLVTVLAHAFRRELVAAASLIQEAYLGGVEIKQVAVGLTEALRHALFVKLNAADALLEVTPEEKAEYEELVQNLSPEALQASFRAMNNSLEEILRSPLPRASLEMALARLAGLGKLSSLDELIAALQNTNGAAPACPPPASAAPAPLSEKKNAEALTNSPRPVAEPSASLPQGALGFEQFVPFVLQQRANLGALLEHAVPVTAGSWSGTDEVRIGFRKSHSFYQLQAQHKANFEQLERHLGNFLGRRTKLCIDTLPDSAPTASVSLVEREKASFTKSAAERKKKFLEQEIVRETKEIFGAELSSFDIDKTKL
jgi:DNA polymerase III subunit gamma/tau